MLLNLKMDFVDVVKNRKSIRSFSKKQINKEILKKILNLATYAPTSCNQQLWNFIVIDSDEIKSKFVKFAASNTLFLKAPILIAITYDGWNYKEAIQGGSLALGNLLLAAEYYGLGALPMNSYGSETNIRKILNIPKSEIICCFVALGYPDIRAKNATLIPRKSVEEVMHLNYFDIKNKNSFSYNPNLWTLNNLLKHQRYYCRKTFLGKEMDIYNNLEKSLIKKIMKNKKGPFLDLMSYDGSYLSEFPENANITTYDLCNETSEYTKESVKINKNTKKFSYKYFSPELNIMGEDKYQTVTMLYKAERLPDKILNKLFFESYSKLKNNGQIVIIARKNNIFFSVFYKFLKFIFGDDIRKTGIYTFFGPYKPVDSKKIKKMLKKNKYRRIVERKYFFIPPFFDQAYQMFLQYKKSEGSSYLHRLRRKNIITKFLNYLLKKQGYTNNSFGSICVIEATK